MCLKNDCDINVVIAAGNVQNMKPAQNSKLQVESLKIQCSKSPYCWHSLYWLICVSISMCQYFFKKNTVVKIIVTVVLFSYFVHFMLL